MDRYGPIWTDMDRYGPIWTVDRGPIWTTSATTPAQVRQDKYNKEQDYYLIIHFIYVRDTLYTHDFTDANRRGY